MAPSLGSSSLTLLSLALTTPLLAKAVGIRVRNSSSSCSDLATTLASNTTFTITNVTYYEANATFSTSTSGGSQTTAGAGASYSDLPAFCRRYLCALSARLHA